MEIKCPKCQTDNPETQKFCGECATPLPPSKEVPVTETVEAPKEELTRGTTFAGRYEIIEELGKGGMGKVYRAEDKKIKEEIALKLIKPEIAKDKKTIERFSNELRLARKIRHNNICQMFDLGEEKGTQFITMEYVPGEDLRSSISRFGQLPIGKSISVAKQICEGLSEAHRLGVVHRDLKSNNIMIDKEGDVRIMDFGIARSLEAKGITAAGVMIGTPEYMSPEQVEAKGVDQRSDIYSLGVILYEMVTGKVPFEGDTPFTIGMKHKGEMPKNPKELNTQISDDLNRVILRCLEKDKEKRFQNAREVRSELSRIEQGLPTTEKVRARKKPLTSKEITVTFGLKKLFVPALLLIAIVIIGLIIWSPWKQKESVSIPTEKPSVAVLPFEDLSPEKDQEYFCEGMSEALINALTSIKDLRVPARTSSFLFRRKEHDVREIGDRLNVESVLEGSVQKAGDRLRVSVKLISTKDGFHIWSEQYNRESGDVFAIQDEISLAIVNELKVKLLGGEKARLLKRHTDSSEAYNMYLRGRYFWNKRTEQDVKRGIGYFKQAVEIDPAYALAFTGLSDSYNILGYWGYLPSTEAMPKARSLAKKALEIDEFLAEAHTSLAFVTFYFDYDWAASEAGFKRAIELNPGYATAHQWYAAYFLIMNRNEEGIRELKLAKNLDPLSLQINADLGSHLIDAGRLDEGLEQLRKTLEMNPQFSQAHMYIGRAYMEKEEYEKAITALKKASRIPWAVGVLGYSYAKSGEKDKAMRILQELKEQSKEKHIGSPPLAYVYLGLGEIDKAIEWFEKSYNERDPIMPFINAVVPEKDEIRSDPRFKALLKKMNLN
jgi:serine/threonine protein kinase/tetratricopeptide (TPR) repeat protein